LQLLEQKVPPKQDKINIIAYPLILKTVQTQPDAAGRTQTGAVPPSHHSHYFTSSYHTGSARLHVWEEGRVNVRSNWPRWSYHWEPHYED